MFTNDSTSLTQDMSRIHKAIAQSLDMNLRKIREYRQTGFPSPQEMLGFIKFNRCLMSVICSHHQAEDLIAFPAFRKVLGVAPYEQFAAEHRQIETLLALVPELLIDISGDAPEYGLRLLGIIMRKILKVWAPHASMEEQYFSTGVLNGDVELQARTEISAAINHYNASRYTPPLWVIPFLLFDIEGVDQTSDEVDLSSAIMDPLVSSAPRESRFQESFAH